MAIDIQVEESKDVFVAMTNTDLTEGRGKAVVLCVCEKESTAERRARGRYIQGHDCPVIKDTAFLIGGKWYVRGVVESPSKEDVAREVEIERRNAERVALEAVIARAAAAGLSSDDIETLRASSAGKK